MLKLCEGIVDTFLPCLDLTKFSGLKRNLTLITSWKVRQPKYSTYRWSWKFISFCIHCLHSYATFNSLELSFHQISFEACGVEWRQVFEIVFGWLIATTFFIDHCECLKRNFSFNFCKQNKFLNFLPFLAHPAHRIQCQSKEAHLRESLKPFPV